MSFLCGIAKVKRCQERKNISLQEGHKKLYEKHEYHEQSAAHAYAVACYGAAFAKN